MGKDIDWEYIHQEFPDVDFSDTSEMDAALRRMFARDAAIAMEARRAETGTGSVHDSAAIAQPIATPLGDVS